MPGAPFTNWMCVGFLILVAAFLALDPGTRVALYIAPVWFAMLWIYLVAKSRPAVGIAS